MSHPSVHAQNTPDKIAYRMAGSGESLTYRELDRRSNQGAHLFRSLGLQKGDHIALLMENTLAFMEICWAAQRSGLYYTAISRYLTADEIAYIVRDCGARGCHHHAEMHGGRRAADRRNTRRPCLLHYRPGARIIQVVGRSAGSAANDTDRRRSRRLRHALFVGAPLAGPRASSGR